MLVPALAFGFGLKRKKVNLAGTELIFVMVEVINFRREPGFQPIGADRNSCLSRSRTVDESQGFVCVVNLNVNGGIGREASLAEGFRSLFLHVILSSCSIAT
jgi:hypothetical protein